MAYYPPYSRRETTRESRRQRTDAELRRRQRHRANRQHRRRAQAARQLAMESNGKYRFDCTDWDRLVARQLGRCFYCGLDEFLTADHVVPLSRGGSHGPGNIVGACGDCNEAKGHMLLIEWRLYLRK